MTFFVYMYNEDMMSSHIAPMHHKGALFDSLFNMSPQPSTFTPCSWKCPRVTSLGHPHVDTKNIFLEDCKQQ
jgi:hypothetical protein